MSRPRKFTKERMRAMLAALRQGATLRQIARDMRISRQTLYNWLGSDKPEFMEFQDQFHRELAATRGRFEKRTYRANVRFWLLCGPGRERYDADGNLIEGWSWGPTAPPRRKAQITGALAGDEANLEAAILARMRESTEFRAKLLKVLVPNSEPPTQGGGPPCQLSS